MPEQPITYKTLRDEIAMLAMAAMLKGPQIGVRFSDLADMAYKLADAMLKAREAE